MSWEDKYYQIRSEKEELVKKFNDLHDTARILRTKCAQLESFKKKIINGASVKAAAADAGKILSSIIDAVGKPNEHQQDYEDLFKCYEALQRDYRAVVVKHKSSVQVIGKLKKELQSLKRRHGQGLRQYRQKQAGGCMQGVLETQRNEPAANNEEVGNVLGELQQRLGDAEKLLQSLTAENEGLKGQWTVESNDPLILLSRRNTDAENEVGFASIRSMCVHHHMKP